MRVVPLKEYLIKNPTQLGNVIRDKELFEVLYNYADNGWMHGEGWSSIFKANSDILELDRECQNCTILSPLIQFMKK